MCWCQNSIFGKQKVDLLVPKVYFSVPKVDKSTCWYQKSMFCCQTSTFWYQMSTCWNQKVDLLVPKVYVLVSLQLDLKACEVGICKIRNLSEDPIGSTFGNMRIHAKCTRTGRWLKTRTLMRMIGSGYVHRLPSSVCGIQDNCCEVCRSKSETLCGNKARVARVTVWKGPDGAPLFFSDLPPGFSAEKQQSKIAKNNVFVVGWSNSEFTTEKQLKIIMILMWKISDSCKNTKSPRKTPLKPTGPRKPK